MYGHLISRGVRIHYHRIHESQSRVDPEGLIMQRLTYLRQHYSVRGPQHLWHTDITSWQGIIHVRYTIDSGETVTNDCIAPQLSTVLKLPGQSWIWRLCPRSRNLPGLSRIFKDLQSCHLALASVEQWLWILENNPRVHKYLYFCDLRTVCSLTGCGLLSGCDWNFNKCHSLN